MKALKNLFLQKIAVNEYFLVGVACSFCFSISFCYLRIHDHYEDQTHVLVIFFKQGLTV